MYEIPIYDSDDNTINYLVQFDKDINIRLKEDIIDNAYVVNFFNSKNTMAYVVNSTYENGVLTCKIPNILLRTPLPIFGYVAKGDMGNEDLDNVTVRSVCGFTIPVRKRAAPSNYIYEDDGDYITIGYVLEEAKAYADEKIAALRTELYTYTDTRIESIYDDVFVDICERYPDEVSYDLGDIRYVLTADSDVLVRYFIKNDDVKSCSGAPVEIGSETAAPFLLVTEKIYTLETGVTLNKQTLICTNSTGHGTALSNSDTATYIRYIVGDYTDEGLPYLNFTTWTRLIDKAEFNTALNTKVDKVVGMGLSHNDFTDYYKGVVDNLDDIEIVDLCSKYPFDAQFDVNTMRFVIDTNDKLIKYFYKNNNTKTVIHAPTELGDNLTAPFCLITERIYVNGNNALNKQTFICTGNTGVDQVNAKNQTYTRYVWLGQNEQEQQILNVTAWDRGINKTELDIGLSGKVDKVPGKGLSTNDYTDEDKAAVEDWKATTGISNSDIDAMLAEVFT